MRRICVLILLFAIWPLQVVGQTNDNIFIGTRPQSMGGAFTAVADDGNAMFYNTAGLHTLSQHEATFVSSNLYGLGINTVYGSYVMPLSGVHAIGIDWQHIGFGDDELAYNRDLIKLAYSRQLHPKFSFGVGAKFLMTDLSLDGTSIGEGLGYGFDLGILMRPHPKLRLGLNVNDVADTKVQYNAGGSEAVLPRGFRGGIAWQPVNALTLAADVSRAVHVGGEYWIHDALAVRAGATKDLQTGDALQLTFGVGLKYRILKIDFTHEPSRQGLGQTQRYGVAFSFDPSPHLIKVVDARAKNLYASFYRQYAAESAGSLTLQNKHSEPLDCVIQVTVTGLSDQVTETRATLAPKTVQSVPFRAVLSDAAMKLEGDRPVDLEIRIEYATKRARKSIKRTITSMAFRPGSLTWDAPGKAAAFVTHQDPTVELFARGVYNMFPEDPPAGMPMKVYQAILLFNALSEYGIRYVEDPENPFSQISTNQQYVDRISYPRDALRVKTGDCDDDVVLYCSLLENLNIQTGFVEPAGHIFMMFNTGYTVMDDGLPFIADNMERFFDSQDGTLWLPIEITLIGTSFNEAWDRGVEQMNLLRREGRFEWTPTREAWQVFAPAAPPGEAWSPTLPPKSLLEKRVQADIDKLTAKE